MKRKLSAFLVVLCIIFGLSAFTACSNSKDNVITKNEFTVTFNSNGGSEISPFKGAVLETLPTPTKAGFAFDGWYSTADLSGTAQTAPLNLVADISLYAKWKIAHEHTYGEWVVTMPATCTTEGKKTKTCSVCGNTQTEVIPATGHTFGEWVVTTPATCTTDGTRTKTCTVCGEKLTETIPALGGTHNYGEWVVTTPATCTIAGTRIKTCSVCGNTQTEVIPATGHIFGEWVVTTPATCTTDGTKTRTCSVCGEKVTETIPALGGTHNYGEWIETETGLTRECTVCHHKEVTPYTTGLQFADVNFGGNMVHMVSGIGSATGAISIPKIHDGKPVGGIKELAFSGCASLTSVVIPNSVTVVGDGAFSGCSALSSAVFPSSVIIIGSWAFSACTALTSITVDPNNANYQSIDGNLYDKSGTTLIQYAVASSATSFSIPSSVTRIEDYAFFGCASLASINIPSSVTSIGEWVFSMCLSLANITVDQNNTNYKSIDCNLYDKAGTTLIQYTPAKTNTSFSIPSSVSSIGEFAFSGCLSLTSISIPSSVTSISEDAFFYCLSLTSIIIPNSVQSIMSDAFDGCFSLTIYAEASEKPNGWNNNWNPSNRPIYWFSATAPTGAPATGNGYWRYVDGVPTKW